MEANTNRILTLLPGASKLVMLILVLLIIKPALSSNNLVCPGAGHTSYPVHSEVDEAPSVAFLKDEVLPDSCHVSSSEATKLAVAVAARFKYEGTVNDMAARIGAISKTTELMYWSVTDKKWRELLDEAFALESRDKSTERPDFSSDEILSGQLLYFAQNDTRSWGTNVLNMQTISSAPDHLIFRTVNASKIKAGPITLFRPGDVKTVVFLERINATTWSYYGLVAVEHGSVSSATKSVVNRQVAMYRHIAGQIPDQYPPVSR